MRDAERREDGNEGRAALNGRGCRRLGDRAIYVRNPRFTRRWAGGFACAARYRSFRRESHPGSRQRQKAACFLASGKFAAIVPTPEKDRHGDHHLSHHHRVRRARSARCRAAAGGRHRAAADRQRSRARSGQGSSTGREPLPEGRACVPRRAAQPDRGGGRGGARRLPRARAATASSRSAAARRSTSPRAWRCSRPMPGRSSPTRRSMAASPRITAAVAPVIAIPTTAGTGAEVGRAALLTLDDGRKLGFISPHLIPKRAICDPGADARPAAVAHRRDRPRRAVALHRDVPVAALQPAGRGDRARRRGPHLAQPRARLRRRRRPRGAHAR